MPQDNSLLDAPRVLKPATVKAVLAESLRAQQIADRWAAGAPHAVRDMEADGTLLSRIKEQADLESQTISDARIGGAYSDTPDSEILAMYEVPLLPIESSADEEEDPELRAILDELGQLSALLAASPIEEVINQPEPSTYTVLVLDMFHPHEPDEEIEISGFETLEAAREYAHRRTRASVEALRPDCNSAKELRELWYTYGEDCIVIGGDYAGASELDYFIEHPATAEEQNCKALDPRLRK